MMTSATTGKRSAIIDKSLFHELCKVPDASARESLWHELHTRYQLLVPLVLIEETVANAVEPGIRALDEVQRLVEQVGAHSPCWVEDMHEIAFSELVEGSPQNTLRPLPDYLSSVVFRLRRDDDSLKRWVQERKQSARAIHERWKAKQTQLGASARKTELTKESELFDVVRVNFSAKLKDATERRSMLESIFGKVFRKRHGESESAIDDAFSRFTPDTHKNYPVTLRCIECRLAFFFAPIYTLPGASPNERLRFLRQEPNNLYDSEYVSWALRCDRFLTRDKQQARMCRVFKLAGRWKGEVVFLPPDQNISTALPGVLV